MKVSAGKRVLWAAMARASSGDSEVEGKYVDTWVVWVRMAVVGGGDLLLGLLWMGLWIE